MTLWFMTAIIKQSVNIRGITRASHTVSFIEILWCSACRVNLANEVKRGILT